MDIYGYSRHITSIANSVFSIQKDVFFGHALVTDSVNMLVFRARQALLALPCERPALLSLGAQGCSQVPQQRGG